jgi:hypothetical protein
MGGYLQIKPTPKMSDSYIQYSFLIQFCDETNYTENYTVELDMYYSSYTLKKNDPVYEDDLYRFHELVKIYDKNNIEPEQFITVFYDKTKTNKRIQLEGNGWLKQKIEDVLKLQNKTWEDVNKIDIVSKSYAISRQF